MKSRTDNISSEAKTSKGFAYDSRWMIISAIALALFLFRLEGRAQLVSSNPMEYVALAEGKTDEYPYTVIIEMTACFKCGGIARHGFQVAVVLSLPLLYLSELCRNGIL